MGEKTCSSLSSILRQMSAAVAIVLLLAGYAVADNQKIFVTLDSPDPFQPATGDVEMAAVVTSDEEIERVVFYVDDIVVGEVNEPPYRLRVQLEEDNIEHHFRVVAYGVSDATASAEFATPRFRVDEEVSFSLQQLYVTVSREGQRVLDLDRRAFEVFDEGDRQRLVTFARGDTPFTAAVLVDASASMEGEKLRLALAGARAFFSGMRPLDEGRLLAFSDRILHATPFTTFPEVLTTGLANLRAQGGTALNDHLYLALKQLEQRQGRRVVILLSDGVDSHSVLSMLQVADKSRRSQALIYWLRLAYGSGSEHLPDLTTAWRNSDDYRREFEILQRTVAESGGRAQLLKSAEEIETAFRDILQELRDQYVLGYYPSLSRHDGSWRRVRVKVSAPGLEVRTRGGYLDY